LQVAGLQSRIAGLRQSRRPVCRAVL
jgi:hypothetical protein